MGIVIDVLVAAINGYTVDSVFQPPQVPVIGAYYRLKSALERKCGVESDLVKALEMLEQRPASGARIAVLEEEIAVAQVEQDTEIVGLAEALLKELNTRAIDEAAGLMNGARPREERQGDDEAFFFPSRHLPPTPAPLQRPPKVQHFVDRQAELNNLVDRLQPGQHVVLYGPGGVGKSTLAAEAIWQLAPDQAPPANFPDGIIYYNFYSRPQVALLWEHIVQMFDEEPWPTPKEAAEDILVNHRVLLVLDGVERADHFPELLTIRGECGLLMTSRHRLNGATERQLLEPLSLEEAVRLLHAWSQSQTFNKTALAAICELLGRLPLALRLAGCYMAARRETVQAYLDWLSTTSLVRLTPVQRVEAGVSIVLDQTLAQLDQSSQDLLSILGLLALAPVEQTVLAEALNTRPQRRLWNTIQRVFKQELAESTPSIRYALQELVNYGLLWWRGQQCVISHPLIYNYIQQRLETPPDAAKQLVTYYTLLAGEQILLGVDGYTRLNAERPHLMELLAGCIRRGQWKAAHDLAIAIEDYLDLQGHNTERVITNQVGLEAARKLGRGYNEVAWLGNLGLAYKAVGQVEQAIQFYEQALASAREVGDQRSEGNWLGNLGLAYRDLDQIDLARQYLNQSLTLFELIDSPSADVIRDWLTELEDAR